jgi:hypothetical protein
MKACKDPGSPAATTGGLHEPTTAFVETTNAVRSERVLLEDE